MQNRYALLSVYDKTGIEAFAQELVKHDFELISTGGTAAVLQQADIPLKEVSELTGFPEMLDGRVKTLHPIVHAGILARRDEKLHVDTLKQHKIRHIDIVVCNLYPFEQTIQKLKATIQEVVENIDIGGPTLIRAAAKNYKDVMVLTHSSQYKTVISALQNDAEITLDQRKQFALQAFSHTAQYDTIISTYFRNLWNEEDLYPDNLSIALRKLQDMRYGENPHQQAAFYQTLPPTIEPSITTATKLQGKELSYNNILDANCAIECIKEFSDPTCVIIKHATPCGIASASYLLQAWKDAYATDEYSPFGGIVAFNQQVDEKLAAELSQYFLEVVIAPSYHNNAQKLFKKKKNLRLLQLPGLDKAINRKGIELRSVVGGYLLQERDTVLQGKKHWKTVTKKKPTTEELSSMEFAIKCVKHVKSNSVLFVKNTRTVAIGGGQTSRVDATWIATHKGKENIHGSIMASDAFFPFKDAVDVAAQAGVKTIIQPGGSIRDNEVIDAANRHNIAMVFSGQRYFKH